ncbi:MAG: DMT family transporter [Hyphomonas sp.]|nr:DMT family transporter [Hyphomonas sp.]
MSNAIRRPALQGALVLCWSSGFIGAVLASQTSSVFLVLLWRFVVASVFLAPFIVPYLKRQFLPALGLQALVGAFAMFGYLATGVKAIDMGVPTGTAALIASLQPLATAALAGIVLREAVSKTQWVGLCFGLAGVTIAVGAGLGAAPLWGFALSFISMLSIVVATLIAKRSAQSLPLLPILAVHCIVSAILFLVLAATEGMIVPQGDAGFWLAVIWFVLFSTIGAYGFYWLCLREMSATQVASLIYLTPPVTMIWAWLMFREQISSAAIAGFGLCIVGVWLANRSR